MSKEVSVRSFAIVMIVLIIILVLIMTLIVPKINHAKAEKKLKKECATAICNEDNTICYNYALNEKDNTVVTWKGNCSSIKK